MRKALISAGIGLALMGLLIFIVFNLKGRNNAGVSLGIKSVQGLMSEGKLDEAKSKLDEAANNKKGSNEPGSSYLELAKLYENKNEFIKARDIYQTILSKYQNVENILDVEDRLGKLNVKILFLPLITDKDELYTVEPGDTLSKIARKFGTTVDLIKISNSLKSDAIRANSKLKISKAKYNILVDKSQNLLTIFSDNVIFKVYQVSTGENGSTPAGTFKIVNKIKDPVWYTQGAIVPPESPDNILGSRWLGLSVAGYGVHGTVDPDSLGKQITKGCVRMRNSEVEELYVIIPVGTEVVIVE